MWFDDRAAVQEAYRFIKFLTKKKSISDHRIDIEALIQETLIKVISATRKELTSEHKKEPEQCLSTQNSFNHLLKAYTYRAFESVYLDMSANVTFRRKSAAEQAKSSDPMNTVQLVHISEQHQENGQISNIYELLPSAQPSPDQAIKINKTASLFTHLLIEAISQETDIKKQALFYDFFSLAYRKTGQTQKQLGEKHGFQGNTAITHISRFVSKLAERVKESGLNLELSGSQHTDLDIYFLNHSNKLNETISV